ncbi:hypothetical protein D8674_012249 [Pyrus ussuriensis x Pyrus communis]|uniref:RNase H type-1 domain-containing protein n=1 Tax=Pyrus ussuriensis x Pyrus communis TaxID=2448454 RepID=A0A5N5G5N5_9ROSA|nr:hypothetical protein D8674_012249 [Pyrus ussuriensis x Pyrus communis]
MNLGSVTINVVEALALREALVWARMRNLNYVVVEGDSKLVIDVVRGACDKANFVADAISSIGLKRNELCIWDACLPMEANMAFLLDCNGTSCVKGSYL